MNVNMSWRTSRYQIVSPGVYFLYIQDYCILRRILFTIFYQKSWQTSCIWVVDQFVEWQTQWARFFPICMFSKTMFIISQVVCVFFAVYKKYTCYFLNERWYKFWLKIEVTCFSNTRFTCKIIFDISKQAKFVSLRRQPGAVLAPVSHRSSRRRRQWKM